MSTGRTPDDHDLMQMFGADTGGTVWDPADPGVLAARRRRTRRRRTSALITLLVVVAAVGTYVPLTLLAPADAAAGVVEQPPLVLPPPFAPAMPDAVSSAISVAGAEEFAGTAGAGGILAASGSTEAQPIASISKVITALVVLDAKPLAADEEGPTLTFSKADNDLYDKYYLTGATIHGMKIGSSMSQRDALGLMLVVSASNYAEAVSTWAFGSQAKFRSATKNWLSANGLTATTIVEPTGIDPRNTSTPVDLIAIARLALQNPVVADLVAARQIDVPGLGTLANRNSVLGIDGIDGIKTGTLDEAGACLLFSATIDTGAAAPLTVVGVVLGSSDHFEAGLAARAMIDGIRAGFHRVPLVAKGDVFGSYTTPWGDEAGIVADTAASVLSWADTPITATVDIGSVTTGKSGTVVGSVTFVAENKTVSVPLVLNGPIAGPDEWWRLTHPGELLFDD